jgi:cyclophilin family peptidyl-prolyl cis-trans isomerase
MRTGTFSRDNRPVSAAVLQPHCKPSGKRKRKWRKFRALLLCLFPGVISALTPWGVKASQYVELDYNLTLAGRARNSVFLELFDDKPITQANFLQYVNNTSIAHGNYSGSFMHRLARGFVIQGGGYYPSFVQEPAPLNVSLDPNAQIDLDGNLATPNPTIVNEHNTSPVRSNTRGTIAMARINGQPNSASNQWFVNLADNSSSLDSLDGGFTVFGQVAGDGMAMFDAFNTLGITNLNPDTNDDGTRDGGPFFNYNASTDTSGNPTDGVPYLHGGSQDILVVINQAKQVDYLGANLITTLNSSLTFRDRDAFIDTGTSFSGNPVYGLGIGVGRTLGIREGFSLNRDLTNDGTLAPGEQLGSITVQNYVQFVDGTLKIQLAGTTADTQYDRIVATGTATINGTLDVSFLTGFNPSVGNTFTFLTATQITGTFLYYDLPNLASGLVWHISKTPTAYTLSIVAADFDRDGVVDMSDYVLWRNTKNMNVTPYSGADANGDGFVNDADYAIWRSSFGDVRGTASGAGSGSLVSGGVPEPASVLLISIGFLSFFSSRHRRL